MLTDAVKAYLRHVARGYIEYMAAIAEERHRRKRDALWAALTKAEQDAANEVVEAVFQEWL